MEIDAIWENREEMLRIATHHGREMCACSARRFNHIMAKTKSGLKTSIKSRPARNRTREDRILRARCIAERAISPLRAGEKVEVLKMAPEDDCASDMFAIIRWADRTMGVPLSQLKGVAVDKDTKQAIDDWHYWIQQGYEF